MTLILQPGVPEDMEEFTEVFLESFRNDAVHPNLMRSVPHDEKVACYAEMLRKELENPWVKDFKIVDTETRSVVMTFFSKKKYIYTSVDSGYHF